MIVVTIDGPAGVGKSSVARGLAETLGWAYLDTGALYRLVTLAARGEGIASDDAAGLARVAAGLDPVFGTDGRITLEGVDVTEAIRSPDVTAEVPVVASHPQVRARLLDLQRAFASREGHIVAEGRDTGTVVFPDARLKVFLDADPAVRARRRHVQDRQAGRTGDAEDVAAVERRIRDRDRRDASRAASPLVCAPDAWRLDTTEMTLDEVLDAVRSHVRSGIPVASGDEPTA